MKTITFYSYKGGVGRSLALVNIATRLVEFGKKVCVIDFDLEAPGLHIKFPVHKVGQSNMGIVDYVYEFSNKGKIPLNISDYSVNVEIFRNNNPLTLITAGNIESPDYWRKLSSINWYDLIYENSNGLSFFLNLKESIETEIKPDFLLIDSRTGISEMSGITLSLLADEIVIVAANNKENLTGAKKIINSINNPDNNILGNTPKINFVLSRIPFSETPEDKSKETLLISRIIREYLVPHVTEVNLIHSDRELEVIEKVKIAYEKDESSTQIAIDYLKLFERLTKNDLSDSETMRFKNIRESEKYIRMANNSEKDIDKIEYLTKAIELNNNNPETYILRANIYHEWNEIDKSNSDIEFALTINPNYIPAYHLLVVNLIEQRRFLDAEEKLNRFEILTSKSNINTFILKIRLYTKLNRIEEAEFVSTEMVNIFPEYSLSFSCRANCKRLLKKFDEALEDSYVALELDSENIHATLTLSEIYLELGRISEFFIQFEIALKGDPQSVEIAINEEEVYSAIKNNVKFKNLLSKYAVSQYE